MPTGRSGGSGVVAGAAAAAQLGGKPLPAAPQQPQAGKQSFPSLDLDPKHMAQVVAFVIMGNDAEARDIAGMLNRTGVTNVTTQTDVGVIRSLMMETTPDLIIMGADAGVDAFTLIKDIRHSKVGTNPFLTVTTLVDNDQVAAVKVAMQAGTDDIIVKPLKEEQLLSRLKRVTLHRQAFVVTSDYLGPDRRGKNRPSSIRRIQVLNTMLDKATGKEVKDEDVKAAVENSMNDVLHARLDSNSYRLGFVCTIIMDAYENNQITPDVKDKILVLVDVLRDAAKTAERINQSELGLLCGSLGKQVEEIAERYDNPSERDIKVIQKLTRAVMMVVKPHVPAEQLEKEARAAAQNYLNHKRAEFEKSAEIQRSPADRVVETVDEQIMEILQVPKGQPVFQQGEPATAAYILASGSIAIYRDIDGKRAPVSRVRKGEMFGEMAIIDGTARRATAIALEDCTLSLIAKEMIEEKMNAADPIIRQFMHVFINSLRVIPESFVPRPRNLEDVGRDMKDQALALNATVEAQANAQLNAEMAGPLAKLHTIVAAIAEINTRAAAGDPRLPARPPT
jgi:CRP/FNR family transcriptional regulator, cyclic AMP receptor protein